MEPEEQKTAYLLSGMARRQQGNLREAVDDLDEGLGERGPLVRHLVGHEPAEQGPGRVDVGPVVDPPRVRDLLGRQEAGAAEDGRAAASVLVSGVVLAVQRLGPRSGPLPLAVPPDQRAPVV